MTSDLDDLHRRLVSVRHASQNLASAESRKSVARLVRTGLRRLNNARFCLERARERRSAQPGSDDGWADALSLAAAQATDARACLDMAKDEINGRNI